MRHQRLCRWLRSGRLPVGLSGGTCEWWFGSPRPAARHTLEMTLADKPPREIQTLIDNHINGFNTHNNKLFLSVFGEDAIIIDGIAPYRWMNPNAPANWIADSDK